MTNIMLVQIKLDSNPLSKVLDLILRDKNKLIEKRDSK